MDANDEWLYFKVESTKVVEIYCLACAKHEDQLKYCRNFNKAFINGVTDASKIKKDNVVKHSKSNMHVRAMDYVHKPKSIADFFRKTPIGKGLKALEKTEFDRVEKLVDIVYMLAKEEKPFLMFADIVALEKRHGVNLGNTYQTNAKAKEFSECIAQVILFYS